jgi:hypothetical protein
LFLNESQFSGILPEPDECEEAEEPDECEEAEMNFSIRIKTSVRWFAPAVLAMAIICSHTAQATEPTGSPDIVAAPNAPADSRDLVAARRERDPADFREPQAELKRSPSSARGERNAAGRRVVRQLRVRREEERARFREVAAASWRYFSRSGTGLILGVGF